MEKSLIQRVQELEEAQAQLVHRQDQLQKELHNERRRVDQVLGEEPKVSAAEPSYDIRGGSR